MSLFQKLLTLKPLAPFLNMEDQAFIEEKGWRDILFQVKQLKDPKIAKDLISESVSTNDKEEIIKGFIATVAAQSSEGEFECEAINYGGCFLEKGVLRLKNPSKDFLPNYIGMGMNAATPECKIIVEGNVGDFLGYRSRKLSLEVRGDARDRAVVGSGGGHALIKGDVAGGIAGQDSNVTIEIEGSVGRINKDNFDSRFLINEDVHWSIGENLSNCFIKINGNVGEKYMKTGKTPFMASNMTKNTIILIGGDIYGSLGKGMEMGKIFVWGKVHGEVAVEETGGGYIYLNKKGAPFMKRIMGSMGKIGIKYKNLKESGYLFVNSEEDVKTLTEG